MSKGDQRPTPQPNKPPVQTATPGASAKSTLGWATPACMPTGKQPQHHQQAHMQTHTKRATKQTNTHSLLDTYGKPGKPIASTTTQHQHAHATTHETPRSMQVNTEHDSRCTPCACPDTPCITASLQASARLTPTPIWHTAAHLRSLKTA